MYSLTACVALTAFLLPGVVARRVSGGDSSTSSGFHLEAPPLEYANLAFYALLFLATLIQLFLTTAYLFRARSGHRSPGVGIVLALVFLALTYAIYTALVVGEWSVDDFGASSLSTLASININVAASLFWDWIDPMVFAAVVVVLRDRHLAYSRDTKETSGRPVPLLPFTLASCAFFVIMFALATASGGVFGSAFNAYYNDNIFFSELNTQLQVANDLFYAYIAIDFCATLFLIAFAIVVKRLAKVDTITTLTLAIIIPLLTLRIVARVIFAILNARLPQSDSYTPDTAYALDLSGTIVEGLLYLAVTSTLVHFLMSPQRWELPGTAAYTGYQPPAQFQGQWGYTGQQQQGYPIGGYPNGGYQFPQGANYYPNQPGQMPPLPHVGEQKFEGGVSHLYANQTPPPPTA